MRKPSLTDRVLRGLHTLAHTSGANEILDLVADEDDYPTITRGEIADAGRAREWISDMQEWRKVQKAAKQWVDDQKETT